MGLWQTPYSTYASATKQVHPLQKCSPPVAAATEIAQFPCEISGV